MKLRQNARELVLIELAGSGLMMGEVRYNKQTETVVFALEKSAFFDLYFPCVVNFDPQRGPVVQPHMINVVSTSSIRIQRSRVNFFVLSQDIAPSVKAQYLDILKQVMGFRERTEQHVQKGSSSKDASKIIDFSQLKGKKDDSREEQ